MDIGCGRDTVVKGVALARYEAEMWRDNCAAAGVRCGVGGARWWCGKRSVA